MVKSFKNVLSHLSRHLTNLRKRGHDIWVVIILVDLDFVSV